MVKVMVVSEMRDPHARAVMHALTVRGDAAVELLDTSEIPMQLSLSMEFAEGRRRFILRRPGNRSVTVDLSEAGAIWWRRPQPYTFPDELCDRVQRTFAGLEIENALGGLYQSLDTFWLNDPARDVAANHKPWQLTVAQEIGLEIPYTLMTNDPTEAHAFWRRHEGNVIYKQFVSLPGAWRETRRLTVEDEEFLDAVQVAPVIFQGYVDAVQEIRAIVVGRQIFAASTDLREAEYAADVRVNLKARYRVHSLPEGIATMLLQLMARMGLEYGAIDLRLTGDGHYVFLEVNSAGQFLYIERETKQPIAEAIAAHLVENAVRKTAILPTYTRGFAMHQ